MTGETRMLERRVSNNRADLNSDQQLNYFLSWFQEWSDLQKQDFVPILGNKIFKFEFGAFFHDGFHLKSSRKKARQIQT